MWKSCILKIGAAEFRKPENMEIAVESLFYL